MRPTLRACFGAIVILAITSSANSAERKAPLTTITEGELPNGLHYTLVPVHTDKGRVDIRLNIQAGSLDETDAQSGVAHMVEHMVFRASDNWPQGIANAMTDNGWKRGLNYNAVTNYERTQFMFSPPDGVKGMAFSLQALAQIAGHARITQTDLDDERKVILEEWRGKLGVAARMNELRIAALREGSRYPLRPTIGRVDSIEHTPASVLADFYRRWYHPGNMRLLVIGDISPADVREQISQAFSSLPAVAVPTRSDADYNQKLSKQLRVVRLQDSESGGSQVSWVTRFDERSASGPAGYRERLINQITLSALTRQLKRQRNALPDTVGNIVVRKAETGRSTVAFGLFADVMPGQSDKGLETLIQERERLLRYGLNAQDIDSIKAELLKSAQRLQTQPEERVFADWVQTMSIPWQKGEQYVGTQERGARALEELASITPEDVNARLKHWLLAADNLVQFSVPGRMNYNLPLPSRIMQIASRMASASLQPTPGAETSVLPALPEHNTAGSIVSVTRSPAQQVEEWRLSNGDRVIWKRTPLAKDRIWMQAVSEAGFMSRGLVGWQSQLASQLAAQGAPAGWNEEDYQRGLSASNAKLNVSQQADSLEISGNAINTSLEDLLRTYQLLHVDNHLDPVSVKNSVLALSRRQIMQDKTLAARREKDVAELRYGEATFPVPDQGQLAAVTAESLEAQWRILSGAPVTFFIMADLPDAAIKKAVEHYLAGIPRQHPLVTEPYLAKKGVRERVSHVNAEPKADIRLWTFRDEAWTAERAVQVSIARALVNQHLKAVLRDDARGIYNLRFESRLNNKTNRIETELRFSTAPERANQMIKLALQAMTDASRTINAQAVTEQKVAFSRMESARQDDFLTLQHRLQLSYRQFNNPGYLSRVQDLDSAITLEGVRRMASRLYTPENRVIYTVLPQETQQ